MILPPHVTVPFELIGVYLDLIRANRLNLEIVFTSGNLDSLKPDSLASLMDALDYSPSISLHAPYMDLSPGAVDTRIRAVTLDRFQRMFDVAETLKPRAIVFHSGYEKWKYGHLIEPWLEGSARMWSDLIERARAVDTRIAIENIFEDGPENLRVLMEKIGSERVGVCFDTGHCNIFSIVALREWIDALGPYIIEVHLHDNKGDFDSHLAIGNGTFDFQELFDSIEGISFIPTVEAHSASDVLLSLERLKAFPTGF